ncbi:uncharacterized protein BX663DRAFT_428583 [Cokeromyces recurvatus]|uniref:uncharacterized protein n=1 Tax=Cokeromyces recurvatus TaxID=90255 RepID=UPI00222006AD|nr:uncharacterized protein BX663DRAFT_428583 [Cokeromyces recurvatus]KAI7906229.1 hypothetical protein BX663DRAFT_428583 [Cokeromyces recurvatus]
MRFWSQNLFQVMKLFAPGELIISFDNSVVMDDSVIDDNDDYEEKIERLLTFDKNGQVNGVSFPDKLIMIANHQIYADWIYIWFLAYLSKAHGALKIMLKHSLSQIPIYGMRRLEHDKDNIVNNLLKTKERDRPMWLVLFPEGTVISDNTREKSKNYAARLNMEDFKYSLLPRTTGLLLCKETLGNSVKWLYDLTIAYPGIETGKNPEDVMTVKRIFCEGNGPHKIHIFVRRYRLDLLPKETEEFSQWLLQLWAEKDKRLIYFNNYGKLPEEEDKLIKTVAVPIKLKHTFRECYAYLIYLIFYIPIFYLLSLIIHYIYITLI